MIASAAGHKALVARLLDAGASVQARSRSTGRTAVMAAAQAGHLPVLSLLMSADSSSEDLLGGADANGTTALMLAAKNGHVSAVRALLAASADPYAVDAAGTSALSRAATRATRRPRAARLVW